MTQHFIQKCAVCGVIIAQCRCPGPKQVTFGTCAECSHSAPPEKDFLEPYWGKILAILRETYKKYPPFYDTIIPWENLVFAIKSEISWIEDALQTFRTNEMISAAPVQRESYPPQEGDG